MPIVPSSTTATPADARLLALPPGSVTEIPPRAPFRSTLSDNSPYAPKRVPRIFRSRALGRAVRTEIFLPPPAVGRPQEGGLLLLNDGQDADSVALPTALHELWANHELPPLTVVALHADANRLQEYGVAFRPDYKGRGARAGQHTRFITDELLPYVQKMYAPRPGPAHTAYAGFSLGGLSALDITWNNPALFGTAGVFSGALWWRARDVADPAYTDADRLMHQQLLARPHQPGQRFWFQAGTDDETNDRNKNGVIDAIEDTLDALNVLYAKGYPAHDLRYLEIAGGRHHQSTWAEALPDFLLWAFQQQPQQP